MPALDDAALGQLLLDAHTHAAWDPARPVAPATLRRLWELARMGPTANNLSPARLVFVVSPEAKARLEPALDAGNVEKTRTAPVTAIVAHDLDFWTQWVKLAPARDLTARFSTLPEPVRERMALLNGSLQGGYLILAARALGLDCGPMAGFDRAKVDAAFLAGTSWRSSFLLNLGHGDPAKVRPRAARLAFEEACRIE
jgi:3-hydroxypropanoate dehydrogenase